MRPGVYVTETVLATPAAAAIPSAAAGALVAPLPAGPTTPTLVTSWYAFNRVFGDLNASYDATFAANLFFRSGGRDLYVSRVVKSDAAKASVTLLASDASSDYITFTAKSKGSYGNSLRITVTKNAADYYDVIVSQERTTSGTTSTVTLESFYDVDLGTYQSQSVIDIFEVRSQFIDAAWSDDTGLTIPTSIPTAALATGTDGTSGASYDYDTAIDALTTVDRTLVVFSPGMTDDTTVTALVNFAEVNGHFVVLDTEANLNVSGAVSYAGDVNGGTASSHAAVYYPHLWVADPTARSRDAIRKIAPSGSVAGLYLGTDATTGVFKAPAGTAATLSGIVALEKTLTADELDTLNDNTSPVNAIRVVAGAGAVVMGARTLDQTTSTRYVNTRRALLYLERELKTRLEFGLFQNNNQSLWNQMKTATGAFLQGFWGAGGLRGTSPQQAFYVKIDSENNSATDVANGIVNVEIGVALQYPAEFIKINLTQQTQA